MMTQQKPPTGTRSKAAVIRTIPADAPWILLSRAAKQSGLTELRIRRAHLPIRRFGNTDCVAPSALNAWILQNAPQS